MDLPFYYLFSRDLIFAIFGILVISDLRSVSQTQHGSRRHRETDGHKCSTEDAIRLAADVSKVRYTREVLELNITDRSGRIFI